jgi:hypothetical protein
VIYTHIEGNCGSQTKTVKSPFAKTIYVLVVQRLQAALCALDLSHTIIGNAVDAFTTLVVIWLWRSKLIIFPF